jgi:PAS domain S-box-containing protein/diguanylate cyclase (GGDEF)-like protein
LSVSDEKGRILEISTKLLELTGYTKEEVLYRPHAIFRDPDTPKAVYQELWQTIQQKKRWHGSIRNRKKDGSIFYTDVTISPLVDFEGKVEKYVAIRHDITHILEAKERLKQQSRTDALTGIGNRVKLVRDIEKYAKPFVALFDIARFNEINDFYGYELGDCILKAFVERLKKILPHTGNLYRINADEFVFMDEVLQCHHQQECTEKLQSIHESLNKKTLVVNDNLIMLSVITSLSFEPKKSLLLSAEIAKNHGKKHYLPFCVYTKEIEIQKKSKNNILWAAKIKEALETDNIVVYFQPILDNKTLSIVKYEALVRLKNGNDIIAPNEFIDIAKKTHQYLEITKRVIKKACEAFSHNHFSFSINVTMEDIKDEALGEYLWEMVQTYGVQGRMILEIVETENITNFRKAEAFIAKARKLDVKIAIDDFGTGYSNFENLYRLKSDFIKIDGSLIQNIYSVESTLGVIKAIVAFAHSCGSKTIAEYVSSEILFKAVCELGVDFSQGFFIGKAEPDCFCELKK